MTEKTIELAKNVTLTVIAEYYCIHEEGDGWDFPTYHAEGIRTTINFCNNGKTYAKGSLSYYGDNLKWKKLVNVPEEVEAVLTFKGETKDDGVKIQLRKENADKLMKAIEEAKDEEAPAEYKAKLAKEAEEERQQEIKRNETIIAKCEETIANRGSLMTRKEAEPWLKSYNNVVNEGGEGYLPHVYTQEEYESAKKALAALM